MTDPRYFINFAPADAVQYDGTNAAEVEALAPGRVGPFTLHPEYGWLDFDCGIAVSQGAWLVRQGDRVWVQDDEPARVERWLTGQCDFDGSVAWHRHNCECYGPLDRPREVRPVLSNGWTGPWSPIEGGAE